MSSPYAKYKLRPGEDSPQGRLAQAYESGEYGKTPLINRTMEAGAVLLDCNLQELVIGLSKLEAYKNGDSLQRRALLCAELRIMSGGMDTHPAPQRAATVAPAPVPEPEPEAGPDPEPATPARKMPRLGATVGDED